MKCVRCAAELPGGAQFCMRCGTPVSAGFAPATTSAPARAAVVMRPRGGTRNKAIPVAIGTVVLLALALAGLKYFNLIGKSGSAPGGTRVVDVNGNPLAGGPLVDTTGKVGRGGPLTNKNGAASPAPPNPQDVIDYLEFLRKIERERILLKKKHEGRVLAASSKMTLLGADSAIASGEPEISARRDVADFQKMGNEMTSEWQALSQKFLTKQPPQACVQLQTKYYDLLGKTSGALAKVFGAFSKAMGGDPTSALDTLSTMRGSGAGSASGSIAEACLSADDELASVCDRFKIHKDFSIQDEGGPNFLGH